MNQAQIDALVGRVSQAVGGTGTAPKKDFTIVFIKPGTGNFTIARNGLSKYFTHIRDVDDHVLFTDKDSDSKIVLYKPQAGKVNTVRVYPKIYKTGGIIDWLNEVDYPKDFIS